MHGSRLRRSAIFLAVVFPTALSFATYELLTDIEPVSFQFEIDPEGRIPPLDPIFPFGTGFLGGVGFDGPSVTLASLDFTGFIASDGSGFGVPAFPSIPIRPNPANDGNLWNSFEGQTLPPFGGGTFQFFDGTVNAGSGGVSSQNGASPNGGGGVTFPNRSPFDTGFGFTGGGSGRDASDITDQNIAPVPLPASLLLVLSALGGLFAIARRRSL